MKLWKSLRELIQLISRRNIATHAASTGYFFVLSLFPALVLLLSLLRYTPLNIHTLISWLEGIFPEALLPAAEKLILSAYYHTSRAVISLSALTALWSASRGMYSLLKGLNAVYGVTESRGYFYTRVICVGYTFAFLLVILLTLLLHVFGTRLLELLETGKGSFFRFLTEVVDLRFFLLVLLQSGLFTGMFLVLPNRKARVSDCLPGALFAAIGWLVFSQLYSLYVDHFPSYTGIFGSVYGIALSMLWLYFCLSIVFYGGILNYLLSLPDGKN